MKKTKPLTKEELANLDAIPRVAPIDLPENDNAEMTPNDRGSSDESYEDDDIPF